MKRFTETLKWADPWFRKLPPHLKCLWLYLCDSCDGAGVIDLDLDLVSFQIGHQVEKSDMEAFSGRVEWLESGKLWVRKFISFQYGKLSSECKPHAAVLALVKSHGLNQDENERVSKGYPKGIHTLQEKEKDKDKETEQEPCTESEAWAYAQNLHQTPRWTEQAVAKWFATRASNLWQKSRGGGTVPITAGTWRDDLRSSHSWATAAPARANQPGKPPAMRNTL